MTAPPSKRRKMRPNNPITKEKQSHSTEVNNSVKKKQADTITKETKPESPIKETKAKTAVKEKPKQVHSESASELKLAEKTHQNTEKQEKRAKKRAEKRAKQKAEKKKTKHVMKKKMFKEIKVAAPSSSKPAPKVYESASDSDETDKEDVPAPTINLKALSKAEPKPKPTDKVQKNTVVTERENNKEKAESAKAESAKAESAKAESAKAESAKAESAKAESAKAKSAKAKSAKAEAAKAGADTEMSDAVEDADAEMSDADTEKDAVEDAVAKDTNGADASNKPVSNKRKAVDGNVIYRTSDIISDSESEEEEEESSQTKDKDGSNVKKPYKTMEFSLHKTGNTEYLKANRISFRKKRDYDENMTAAENIKGRLNDLFVPAVKDNDFISDSNSDTDSGEDYETREYPSWQRTLGLKHNKETDPWPTQRKFGYSDKLKLERRIKKICKREGLSFVEAREIFSSSQRRPYLRFFQKIAKVFPNMSLHALAKQCKMMYHVKRVSSPWTPEEIAKLKELIEEHGTSPTLLSQYMERSPKNISDFMYNHMSTGKINFKRWTPEEDQIIANALAKIEPGKSFSATAIAPLFNGSRTPKQIHRRYYSIRHLINKDGTIEPKRKATLIEELEYLKRLLKQVEDLGLEEESQLDYSKDKGFVASSFYLKSRCTINGFEKMHIKEILEKLIKRQERIIESRRLEQALGQK